MSTPTDFSTNSKAVEEFTESLPNFYPDYTKASHKATLMHNHILISYFLGDVELHSTKFYTANLGEQDIMSTFLDRLEEDVEEAFTAHELREFFDSFPPINPPEPKYVVNIQPLLDAAPHVPGLVKSHDPLLPHDDDDFTYIQYTFPDGYPLSQYGFSPNAVQDIYAGIYTPDQTDDASSFIDAMESAIEELLAMGFIKEATS